MPCAGRRRATSDEQQVILGAVILIVGVVLLFIPFVCFLGAALMLVGFILLLVGATTEGPRPAYAVPVYYPPYSPMPPGGAPAPPAQASPPVCPRCGQPVQYVYQYQRWYCPTEKVYPWG